VAFKIMMECDSDLRKKIKVILFLYFSFLGVDRRSIHLSLSQNLIFTGAELTLNLNIELDNNIV